MFEAEVQCSLVAAAARDPTTAGVGATALLETRRAVHGLVRSGLERHAGDVAAAAAHGFEHLAWRARCAAVVAAAGGVRATVALGTPRRAAVRAARWLGESAAGIEVLLPGGKGETLATIAAGQCHVARHLVDGSLETNLERTIRPAGQGEITGMDGVPSTRGHFSSTTDEEQCQPTQCSGSLTRYAIPPGAAARHT